MNYIISGIVIRGDGYGRKIGFPTVNLEYEEKNIPPDGVYGGTAELNGKEYKAGIVIGPKENNQQKVEAHLVGFSEDAYGKEVVLKIGKFIREYKKFDTEKELIKQIEKDLKKCSQA